MGFSAVRCGGLVGVGHGIAVGSSIIAGDLTGAGVTVALGTAVGFGVDVPSGSNNRPRLCEIGELGAGVCACTVANDIAISSDKPKQVRITVRLFWRLLSALGSRLVTAPV